MAEMTIRLDDEALAAVEELKRLFNERTANKTIIEAVKNFKGVFLAHREETERANALFAKIKRIERAKSELGKWEQILSEEIGV